MQPIPIPKNEEQRIHALLETDLLDTPRESIFDSITEVLAQLFDMPISLVCLVDKERVWLKSSSGLDGVNEIQRQVGFCPHTITQSDIFEVKNATLDSRFKNSPLVSCDPFFKYYAGAPLITSDGHALGTLCVMDYKPREINENQKLQLKNLAATITAIIDTRRQQNILQTSNSLKLGVVVETSPNETLLVSSTTQNIIYANHAACLNLGNSSEKLKKLKWYEILTESPKELINNYLATNHSVFTSSIKFTGTLKRHDGTTYPVDCVLQTNKPVKNEFFIICNDISSRVNAEDRERSLKESIAHMERINTANTLSTGLAHELNQPLTAISQYCDTAKSIIGNIGITNSVLNSSLQKATSQAFRASEIIKRYKAFTKNKNSVRSLVNISELIEETISLLSYTTNKNNITLETNIDKNIPLVSVDPIQIEQVLLNIINNSIEALSETDTPQVDIHCSHKNNDQIIFSVTDNGPGINNEIFNTLITPNSSSKPEGTGLGLSICNYIIGSHSGKLWHDNDYLHGTRILFSIPTQSEID